MYTKQKIAPFQVKENGLPLSKSSRADALYSSVMTLVQILSTLSLVQSEMSRVKRILVESFQMVFLRKKCPFF